MNSKLVFLVFSFFHYLLIAAAQLPRKLANLGVESYHPQWSGSHLWIGPEWWANPLPDWSMRLGHPHGLVSPKRTLCVLPLYIPAIESDTSSFKLSATVRHTPRFNPLSSAKAVPPPNGMAVGFQIGRKGRVGDYRNSLVDPVTWIDAVITGGGGLSIHQQRLTGKQHRFLNRGPFNLNRQVNLTLEGKPLKGNIKNVRLTLTAKQDLIVRTVRLVRSANAVRGGICLSSGSGAVNARATSKIVFSDFSASGNAISIQRARVFGPILWTQYTLGSNSLHLQAQLAPFKTSMSTSLWISDRRINTGKWKRVASGEMDTLSRTVLFVVSNWNSGLSVRYEVRMTWKRKSHVWPGLIRKEPFETPARPRPLRLAAMSCDKSYYFPQPDTVSHMLKLDPDILFFAGDQIYEDTGYYGVARYLGTELAILDFLRKVMQWGWTWRRLMRDRPTIALTDDHDMYQGNIWGNGGIAFVNKTVSTNWEEGGYLMPGKWVAAVRKVFAGHLPRSPAADTTLPIGFRPYYTSFKYAGVNIAVIEDRTFKTAPLSLARSARKLGHGGDLLGREQEQWFQNWASSPAQAVKIALTQTPFSMISTHSGWRWGRGTYLKDSGAWPVAARDRTVRTLAENNVLSVHGDLHMGMLYHEYAPPDLLSSLRTGKSVSSSTGHYAVCVPGTANGFPRAWLPSGYKKNGGIGTFRDGGGNVFSVLAVANMELSAVQRTTIYDIDARKTAYKRGSGFGIIDIQRRERKAKVSMYRIGGIEGEQFDGFPKTVRIG